MPIALFSGDVSRKPPLFTVSERLSKRLLRALRSIIEKAQKEEIVLMTNSKIICRRGRISDIEKLDSALDEDIIVALEARITPENTSH